MASAILTPPDTLESARTLHAQNRLLQAAVAYREALASDPQSQPALLGLSLIARQSNQLAAALRMAQAALAADRTHALAWANYGDLLLTAGSQPRAREAAQAAYCRAIALDPTAAVAHYGLANTFALEENYRSALPHFVHAAQLNPAIPEFHFAHGFALGKHADHAQAIAAYRRAVHLRSNFASAWLNLGVELIADGRDSLAELCYIQALACSPVQINTQISTHLNHGHLLRSRKNYPAAKAHYESALNLAQAESLTRLTEVYVAFTYLHLEEQQFAAAHRSLQSAQQLHSPNAPNPEIANVRGILLLAEYASSAPISAIGRDAGSPDLLNQAIDAFRLAEREGHKTAPSNRGNALLRQGRVQEALDAHQSSLQLDPHHPGVRYNLALTQLRAGNFLEGWRNYEIRWQFREVHPHPRRFPQPRWQGQPLAASATLLVYAEQGLGDTLQFLRYLQLLPPVPILLEVQPPLIRLISHTVAVWNRGCRLERSEEPPSRPAIQILSQGDRIPPFTHHIPLMSLPALLQTTPGTIPTPIPYVFAPPNETDARADSSTLTLGHAGCPTLAAHISLSPGQEGRRPKIGLHWAGNPNYRADRERSTTLDTFLPLLEIQNIHWISLQKGIAALQIAQIPPHLRPEDACSRDLDLADTAAVLQTLDLVLTTDSAVAHLAGAMGKPLWLLLPWQSDWRWMQERPDTPWYPQARLFRQSSQGNWTELIARLVAAVQTGFEERM